MTLFDYSGLDAEALAWKLSGCLVRDLDPSGAAAADGRIKTGGWCTLHSRDQTFLEEVEFELLVRLKILTSVIQAF